MKKGVKISLQEICKVIGVNPDAIGLSYSWNKKDDTLEIEWEEMLQGLEAAPIFKEAKENPKKKRKYKKSKKKTEEKTHHKKRERTERVTDEEIRIAHKRNRGDFEKIMEDTGMKYQALWARLKKLKGQNKIKDFKEKKPKYFKGKEEIEKLKKRLDDPDDDLDDVELEDDE